MSSGLRHPHSHPHLLPRTNLAVRRAKLELRLEAFERIRDKGLDAARRRAGDKRRDGLLLLLSLCRCHFLDE